MPHPNRINPATGRRYDFVDPLKTAGDETKLVNELERSIKLLERQDEAIKARDSLMPFIKFTQPDPEDPEDAKRSAYKNARVHDAVARAVEEVEAARIPFLILVMPPRHGKSEIVSRRLPAWYIGRHPTHEVIVGTYSDDFAMEFGEAVRDIMTGPQYKQVFPNVRLARGGKAKDRLKLASGGLITFRGRGGAITGKGGHLIILDDLLKDAEEARSKATRDSAWAWLTSVIMTRRRGKKLVVITFTRWHEDDPIGRLTDPDNPHYSKRIAEKIKIIKLPAIADEDDPLGRKPGEALWPDGPDRYDLDFLEDQKALLGPQQFSALYQQEPTAADGDLFQRSNIRYYKDSELPDELRFYAASDHAVGTRQRNDPSCLLKVGVDKFDNIYLLECDWRRMKSDTAVEAMLIMGGAGNTKPLVWWAEQGHISKSIGPFLYKRMLETGRYLNIKEVNPTGDKVQRAQSIAARISMGKVFFPKNSSWTERAVDELMKFPNGTHDDFVDALAYIGLGLGSLFGANKAPPKTASEPRYGTLAWVRRSEKYTAERRAQSMRGGF